MMNVVGNLKYLESTIKDLLDIGSVELTDSLSQIENNTFIVNINSENIEKLWSLIMLLVSKTGMLRN